MKKQTQLERIIERLVIRKKSITQVEAQGLFGISRLAAVINKMKKQGYTIKTEYKVGTNCPRYAVYSVV